MNTDRTDYDAAQERLRQIKDAIVRLLERNPQGLGNAEIADALGLRSDFEGRHRNYLTYSVLGGLLADGRVSYTYEGVGNSQIRRFFAREMNTGRSAHDVAQEGLRLIKDAVVRLLERNPQGLGNAEIADALGLRSDFEGSQQNYLTYSVLGGLLADEKVIYTYEDVGNRRVRRFFAK